ncbi:MAG TPA: 5'-3' exonuclease H3TH domain-containing protein, partial [Rhodocyclaceae bacterium]|nr:5'-3' exonuclease H3TH domain-containing protein [Rhodocyclaceae bacterium]
MTTLLLVDGSSYLYRAFHAMPDLRNRADQPTGAIYGVVAMLRRLTADFKADQVTHRACVFDAKGKTFRDEWYPAYKANRPAMPEELACQIPRLHEVVRALGWPLICMEGVEADDVIGTLARQAEAVGQQVVISTGDKDIAQLVSPQIKLVNTMSNEILDQAGVLAKFGVPPERIVDYLTLIGDAVDNVPGVAKVGPKTAVKWLNEYGTLDAVIANAAAIGGAVGKNLQDALDFLPLGRKLITIRCDLDLPLSLDQLVPPAPDTEALKGLFEALDFRSWRRDLDGDGPAADLPAGRGKAAPAAAPVAVDATPPLDDSGAHRAAYATLLDWPSFDTWLARIEAAACVALDTETTSLDPFAAQIVGISFALAPGEAAYLPLAHAYSGVPDQLPRDAVLAKLKPWLENPAPTKLGQNLKYDQHVFANHGIRLAGVADDTLLMSYVLDAGKEGVRGHDLETLARRHLGLGVLSYEALCGKGAHQIG